MRQIELIGPVDKRAVAYPLFKICDVLGKTLVITDDANFRRFGEKFETEFTLGRSDFIISRDISQSIIEEFGLKMANYDYVIFISTDNLISGNDLTVYCHGVNQMVCDDVTLDIMETVEHLDVTISSKKPKEKNETFISIEGKGMKYIWDCEENRHFIPCNHPDIARISAFLFTNVLGLSSKDEYMKMLQKEV